MTPDSLLFRQKAFYIYIVSFDLIIVNKKFRAKILIFTSHTYKKTAAKATVIY